MKRLTIATQITNREESPALQKYLDEIAGYALLSIEEEVELFNKLDLLNPDNKKLPDQLNEFDEKTQWNIKKVVEKISRANLRFVVSVAKQYQQKNIELLDLINEWSIWLVKAIYRFDYTKWFKFISYAVWRIRQSILQHLWENKFIRYPANRWFYVNRINKFIRHFEQIYLRLPEAEEVCEGCNITQEDYERYLAVTCSKKISLDSKINPDEDDSKTIWETATMSQYSSISSTDSRVTEQTEINRVLELRLHSDNEMLYKYAFVCVLKFWLNPGWINPDGIGIERTDEEIVEKFLERGLFIKTESVRTLFDRAKKKLATILTPDWEIREEYKVYMEKLKANNPISDIFIKYSKEKITQAVEQLSEKKWTETQAKVFSLKYWICSKFNPDWKKYTIKEIAWQLKRREGSARTTLDIAIKNLNNILSQPEITPKPWTRLNTNNPTSDIFLKYSKEKITQAVEQLSKKLQTRSQAQVFSLRFWIPNHDRNSKWETYDIKKIVEVLGRSKWSVRNTLNLAIKNLGSILSEPEIILEPWNIIPDSNIPESWSNVPGCDILDSKVYTESRDSSDVNYRKEKLKQALKIFNNQKTKKEKDQYKAISLYSWLNKDWIAYSGKSFADKLERSYYQSAFTTLQSAEKKVAKILGIDLSKMKEILENLNASNRSAISDVLSNTPEETITKQIDTSDVNYRRKQIIEVLPKLKEKRLLGSKKGIDKIKYDKGEVLRLHSWINPDWSVWKAYNNKEISESLWITYTYTPKVLTAAKRDVADILGIKLDDLEKILKNLRNSYSKTIGDVLEKPENNT